MRVSMLSLQAMMQPVAKQFSTGRSHILILVHKLRQPRNMQAWTLEEK